jgi:DUF1680 family protein
VAEDGVYVNLFEPSTLAAEVGGRALRISLETAFPMEPHVKLKVETSPGKMRLSVRVPSWGTRPMPVRINGQETATGRPGTYWALERDWRDGDVVEFGLPVGLRLTHYRGADNFDWHIRAALEYGPLLLAVVGAPGEKIPVSLRQVPENFSAWLRPVSGQPLRWSVDGHPEFQVMPYWQVANEQHFSCFPVLAGPE